MISLLHNTLMMHVRVNYGRLCRKQCERLQLEVKMKMYIIIMYNMYWDVGGRCLWSSMLNAQCGDR